MANGEHDQVNFSARWMHNDAAYALKLAVEMGQAVPTSAVAVQLYQLALSQGLANKNMSAVIEDWITTCGSNRLVAAGTTLSQMLQRYR